MGTGLAGRSACITWGIYLVPVRSIAIVWQMYFLVSIVCDSMVKDRATKNDPCYWQFPGAQRGSGYERSQYSPAPGQGEELAGVS